MRQLNKMLTGIFKPAPVRGDPHRKAREEARMLAAARGFEIERLKGGGFNVWPPKNIKTDKFEGDHYANDWEDVLPMARWYAEN